MKKALSILLSLVLVIAALPLAAVELSALTDGDWEYTVSNNEATVTGYTGSLTDIDIPSALGGYPVTKIGNSAFSGKTTLTSVTIPDSVLTIGNSAFYNCNQMT
ncbi:MAG: leucine-rich repeat protein, partial [Clostridia bacterium]|nr:leucine-rich repeat protein [Clostridia bacterium]